MIKVGKENRPALLVIAAQTIALIAGAIFIRVHGVTGCPCVKGDVQLIASR